MFTKCYCLFKVNGAIRERKSVKFELEQNDFNESAFKKIDKPCRFLPTLVYVHGYKYISRKYFGGRGSKRTEQNAYIIELFSMLASKVSHFQGVRSESLGGGNEPTSLLQSGFLSPRDRALDLEVMS